MVLLILRLVRNEVRRQAPRRHGRDVGLFLALGDKMFTYVGAFCQPLSHLGEADITVESHGL